MKESDIPNWQQAPILENIIPAVGQIWVWRPIPHTELHEIISIEDHTITTKRLTTSGYTMGYAKLENGKFSQEHFYCICLNNTIDVPREIKLRGRLELILGNNET